MVASTPHLPRADRHTDIPGDPRHSQRDPREGGCTPAGLGGSTRPSGARLDQPSDCYGCPVSPSQQPLWREHLPISGGHATPAEVVDAWAKEALVWGKSRAVGRAVATDRGREVWGLQLRSRRKRHRVPTILSTKIAARAHFADTDSHRSLSVMSRQLCSGTMGSPPRRDRDGLGASTAICVLPVRRSVMLPTVCTSTHRSCTDVR